MTIERPALKHKNTKLAKIRGMIPHSSPSAGSLKSPGMAGRNKIWV